MRSWSIPIGRFFGADFRLHFTFVILLIYVAVKESSADTSAIPRAASLAGLIVLAVLLHELAHLLVARFSGLAPRAVVLLPIGGINLAIESQGNDQAPRWHREIRVALAGPVMNLAIAMMTGAVLSAAAPEAELLQHPFVSADALGRAMFWINLALGGFNLLPAYPMDGGRILRAVLSRDMPALDATRRAVAIGQGFSMLFLIAGLLNNAWLLWIGAFLFVGGQLEERNVVFQSVLENVRMEDVMLTDFSTLSPADTLNDALSKAVHSLQDDFPVVRGTDLVGTISRQSIVRALRAQGNGYVQAAMSRAFQVAHRKESLASAFRKITSQGATLLPIVDEDRLVGIVTLQNLMHSMSLLAESRKAGKQQTEE